MKFLIWDQTNIIVPVQKPQDLQCNTMNSQRTDTKYYTIIDYIFIPAPWLSYSWPYVAMMMNEAELHGEGKID